MNRIVKEVAINWDIRAPEVRVIDPDGKQLGILAVKEAIRIAEERGLDLVEVAPNSQPPVCRIMNYGKYKYQQSKRTQEARKHQTVIHIKEVKVRPRTEEHDFQFKLRHVKRFLERRATRSRFPSSSVAEKSLIQSSGKKCSTASLRG